MALEGFDAMGEPIRHFLDTQTGEVLALCRDWEDYDELSARIDEAEMDRYRCVEPLDSHQGFRIMEDFTTSLPESAIKSRLLDALSRNKPFRRFKDVLLSDQAMRNEWFQFRDDAHARLAAEWLDAHDIEAELVRRRKE